jgi:hypothetical protein
LLISWAIEPHWGNLPRAVMGRFVSVSDAEMALFCAELLRLHIAFRKGNQREIVFSASASSSRHTKVFR